MKKWEKEYRMRDLCAAFGVSPSGYYRWRQARPSRRAGEDAQLSEIIAEIHRQSRQTYGRPRLTAALRRAGHCHSPKRVRRLMQARGLRGVQRGRYRPRTTESRHEEGVAPNRRPGPGQGPTEPNQLWAADLTYVPTGEGWLYAAAVLDQGSRRVLGLAMAARIDTELAMAALEQAVRRRGVKQVRGVLHHSDRGIQYASQRYRACLRKRQLEASMSRRANCYDNAHMESFWGTLKAELLAGKEFATRAEAQLAIFEWVECYYNRVRLHSALGFRSPVEYEAQSNQTKKPIPKPVH